MLSVTRMARQLWSVFAVVVIAVGTLWLVLFVWGSAHRSDLATYWSFVAAVVVIALGLTGSAIGVFTRARRAAARSTSGEDRARTLDDVADLLAETVKAQWTRAAADRWLLQAEPIPVRWRRSSQPVAGPVSAAVGLRRFPPLPGLTPVRQTQLRQGGLGDLHAVYGGLGSGRIVIIGAPGSGKSGAAVLLILAALRHREQVPEKCRPLVPVPVMFTMHGWDPNIQPLGDWLAGELRQAYPLMAGTSGAADIAGLLGAGRISVILDGLDEIPDELRPAVLRALSQQALFRVVVLSRSAEMAAAARQRFLEGAVALELQDVDPRSAAGYLTRVQRDPPPCGWRELTGRLRQTPGSPIAKALNNPLTLTLIRDTYRDSDVRELLDFCDSADQGVSREDIQDHLLDRVLPIAYGSHSGETTPRYELEMAQRALSYVATRMNQDGSRDLPWWHIPAWTPRAPRVVTGGLVAALGFGLLAALAFGLLVRFLGGSGVLGLVLVLGFGFAAGLVAGHGARGGGSPGRMAPLRWQQLVSRSSLMTGLMAWLAVGFPAVAWGSWLYGDGLRGGIRTWIVVGLVVGLMADLVVGLGESAGKSRRPRALLRWRQLFSRSSLTAGVVTGLMTGLMMGLMMGLGDPPTPGLMSVVTVGSVFGFLVGLMVGLGVELTKSLSRPESTDTSPLTPLASWRRDRNSKLMGGLVSGLVVGFLFGPGVGFAIQLGIGKPLVIGLSLGLVGGLMFGVAHSETWPASLTFAQLTRRGHTPIRLMRFLEDARERHVLRTVGPVYQFRHARLQDRLADQANTIKRANLRQVRPPRVRVRQIRDNGARYLNIRGNG
jgi:hypothetical protein